MFMEKYEFEMFVDFKGKSFDYFIMYVDFVKW